MEKLGQEVLSYVEKLEHLTGEKGRLEKRLEKEVKDVKEQN